MCSIYVQYGAFFCDLMLFKKAKVKLPASFNSFRKNTCKDKEFPFNYHELSEILSFCACPGKKLSRITKKIS